MSDPTEVMEVEKKCYRMMISLIRPNRALWDVKCSLYNQSDKSSHWQRISEQLKILTGQRLNESNLMEGWNWLLANYDERRNHRLKRHQNDFEFLRDLEFLEENYTQSEGSAPAAPPSCGHTSTVPSSESTVREGASASNDAPKSHSKKKNTAFSIEIKTEERELELECKSNASKASTRARKPRRLKQEGTPNYPNHNQQAEEKKVLIELMRAHPFLWDRFNMEFIKNKFKKTDMKYYQKFALILNKQFNQKFTARLIHTMWMGMCNQVRKYRRKYESGQGKSVWIHWEAMQFINEMQKRVIREGMPDHREVWNRARDEDREDNSEGEMDRNVMGMEGDEEIEQEFTKLDRQIEEEKYKKKKKFREIKQNFLTLVRDRPAIWKKNSEGYVVSSLRGGIWTEIGEKLKEMGDTNGIPINNKFCEEMWRRLLNQHSNFIRSGREGVSWEFWEQFRFYREGLPELCNFGKDQTSLGDLSDDKPVEPERDVGDIGEFQENLTEDEKADPDFLRIWEAPPKKFQSKKAKKLYEDARYSAWKRRLISLVRAHRLMWDRFHPHFSRNKNKYWDRIAEMMEKQFNEVFTVRKLSKKWHTLIDQITYYRNQYVQLMAEGKPIENKWIHWDALAFYREILDQMDASSTNVLQLANVLSADLNASTAAVEKSTSFDRQGTPGSTSSVDGMKGSPGPSEKEDPGDSDMEDDNAEI